MASGYRRLKINTQERAVSTDINRLQRFKEQDQAEFFRYLLDVQGNDDLDAGAVITEASTVEAPLRAEIINGLMVSPALATLAISVTPGVLYALAPDAATDESNYKYIRDAGSSGSLNMTANASGSTRIDVIECRVNPTDATVNDNRDIFNPVTGLFTATSVTKEEKGQLEYRIRLGTPGAGYPAAQSGWLPLAVASVPTATTTNDTITFWDVRPLLNDRAASPFNMTRDISLISTDSELSIDSLTDISKTLVRGYVEAVTQKGRKVGGRMRRGTPGTDAEYVDLKLAANQDGSAFPVSTMSYLYLVTPFGLPRWARYTDSPSARVPRSPRGIPVLSSTAPNHMKANMASTIPLPVASGLNGVVQPDEATCIASIPIGTSGAGDFYSMMVKGRVHYFFSSTPTSNLGSLAAASLSATTATWTLAQGVQFPTNARAVYVRIELAFPVPATTRASVSGATVFFGTGNPGVNLLSIGADDATFDNFTGAPTSYGYTWTGWVPMASLDFPTTSPSGSRRLTMTYSTGLAAPTGGVVTVLGWEI